MLTAFKPTTLLRALLMVSLLGLGNASLAGDDVAELTARLNDGASSVSARVRAALRLGTFQQASARRALERALRDHDAQVRGAAAAALGRIGDERSLAALRPLLADSSSTVRRQASTSVTQLEQGKAVRSVHVALGVAQPRSRSGRSLGPVIERAAQRALRDVPGVELTSKDAGSVQLLLEGQLVRLEGKAGNGYYAVSAKVDFVITSMPQRLIRGRMSGAATVHGEATAGRDRKALRELHRDAVAAATQSALTQARAALRADD